MSRKISTERLLKAGFQLTECEDGKFWVLAREAGPEADQIAAICKAILDDVDSATVSEDIILQCASSFQDPSFYLDGFLWMLTKVEFSYIVSRLIHKNSNPPPSDGGRGWRARLAALRPKRK